MEEENDEEEAKNTSTNPQWSVIIFTNLDIFSRNVQEKGANFAETQEEMLLMASWI